MKSKSSRLNPVKQIADDRAKSATEHMVSARSNHDLSKQKLIDLMRYRNEYQSELQEKARTGVSAIQLQQYQTFISQLDKAIMQQQLQVNRAKQTFESSKTNWKHKNSHKEAIHKAVDRMKKQEQKVQSDREQRELDEHNIQSVFRKNSS